MKGACSERSHAGIGNALLGVTTLAQRGWTTFETVQRIEHHITLSADLLDVLAVDRPV
jgi:hypothetical protein